MIINSTIAGIAIGDKAPVRVMGIINLSPESFYQGSVYQRSEEIVGQARQMIKEGCDILDVGGRSTAPGVDPISVETEKTRVLPVLKALLEEISIPISVDTQYSEIANQALKLGAHIINDISALRTDPKIAKIVSEYDCPLVLMATKQVPGDRLGMDAITSALKDSVRFAIENGVDRNKIIIDPGIGRWVPTKLFTYNLEIINRLEELRDFELPILVGISRKSMIGDILNKPDPADRLQGSLAATAIAVYNGAHIIRSHDVGATVDAVRVAQAFRGQTQR